MKTGNDVLQFALGFVGCKYVLGAVVPKNKPNYRGPFDCAEFAAYCNFQTFGILYGCDTDNMANAEKADAYTGYFERDAKSEGLMISVAEAAQTPGAMVLRFPAPGAIGHIVFSQGNGKTMEANCTKYGCIESTLTGRRFDTGILLPGIQYNKNETVISKPPALVYRLKTPYMNDPYIGKIQSALHITADGIFGPGTSQAIIDYQKANGLISDGEIMPGGQTARSLGIL
jgi:N-acetylmuramoyl-L-alanine amidase